MISKLNGTKYKIFCEKICSNFKKTKTFIYKSKISIEDL